MLATARERLVYAVTSGAPTIKRWGGRVLIAVGTWFIVLGIFAEFFAGVFWV